MFSETECCYRRLSGMYFDVDTMNVVNIKKKEEESWLQEMQFRGKSCVCV